MWNWTRLAGRVLIHLGVAIMGIAAIAALVEDGGQLAEAFHQSGTAPVDEFGIPPSV